MLGSVLDRSGQQQRLLLPGTGRGDDAGNGHDADSQGAGLVQGDDPDPAGRLQRLRALDQDAELGAAADRGHERGGRGQAERARAGDHQDGDGRAPRRGGGQPGAQPEAEGRGGQADHAGHEDGRDTVGEPLRAGLAGLRMGDQPGDLTEQRVRADPGSAHDEAAAHVHGAPGDRVVRPDLRGHGFPRDEGRVDGRAALR